MKSNLTTLFLLLMFQFLYANETLTSFKAHLAEIENLVSGTDDDMILASQKIDDFLEKKPDLSSFIDEDVFQYFYQASKVNYNLNNDVDKYVKKALSISEKLGLSTKKVAELNFWIAVKLSIARKMNQAEDYFYESLKICLQDKTIDVTFVALVYKKIGLNSLFRGNSEKAIDMFSKSMSKYKESKKNSELDIVILYDRIGMAYSYVSDYDNAFNNYEIGLDMLDSIGINENSEPYLGSLLQHLGSTYYEVKQYDEALVYNQKALKIRKKYSPRKNNLVPDSYDAIGRIYTAKGDFSKALEYHARAIPLKYEYYGGPNADIAYSHFQLGALQVKSEKYDDAANSYIRCMTMLDSVSSKTFLLYLDAFINLANTYNKAGDKHKAMKAYEEAASLKNSIRRDYQTSNSSMSKIKKLYVTENALQVAFELYSKSKDELYLSKAFRILEENQTGRLLDALHSTSIKSFGKIPETELMLGDSLRKVVSNAEIKLFEANKKSKPESELLHIKQKLLDAKDQWYQYTARVKKEFPDFYNLKLSHEIVTLDKIQDNLESESEVILEYFLGKENLFIFAISKNGVQFKRVSVDFPLKDWIADMLSSLKFANKVEEAAKQIEHQRTFKEIGYQLYQKLISPIDSAFLSDKSLIIIPDKILGYIPFEILLQEPSGADKGFRSLPYLLREHNISYAYSSNILHTLQQRKPNSFGNTIAFSPVFNLVEEDSLRGSLFQDLKYGKEEVESIEALMQAKIIQGDDANIKNFKSNVSDYSIVHLSTHGKADDRLGDYCFLAFSATSDDENNDALYVRDIYDMELSADMVVLSACETGIGELREGEGIISLGRGFMYAGAKSIISTLWSVNDRSSMEIMSKFYTNVKKGEKKDTALRKAKLDYLNETTKPHPAYWAGFTATGDMSAIAFDKSASPVKVVAPILFLLFAGLLYFRTNFSKN